MKSIFSSFKPIVLGALAVCSAMTPACTTGMLFSDNEREWEVGLETATVVGSAAEVFAQENDPSLDLLHGQEDADSFERIESIESITPISVAAVPTEQDGENDRPMVNQ